MLDLKELFLLWQIWFDLGINIFAYTSVIIKGRPYFYLGIPVHIYFSEKYLFILDIYCNFWLVLPNFIGVS